jgi:hypothetical protein
MRLIEVNTVMKVKLALQTDKSSVMTDA